MTGTPTPENIKELLDDQKRSSGDMRGRMDHKHVTPHLLWTMLEKKHKPENGRILGIVVIMGTAAPFRTRGGAALPDSLVAGCGHVTSSGQ